VWKAQGKKIKNNKQARAPFKVTTKGQTSPEKKNTTWLGTEKNWKVDGRVKATSIWDFRSLKIERTEN